MTWRPRCQALPYHRGRHSKQTLTIGERFNGYIAEIILIDSAVPSSDDETICTYLNGKYRIY